MTISSLNGLQAGMAALTLAAGLGACGVSMTRRDGGDASRDATGDAIADVVRDARITDGGRDGGGPCPAVTFNPPHALRFRGYDVRYGGSGTSAPQTTLPFGGSYVGAALVLPSSFGGDASVGDARAGSNPSVSFVGLLQLGGMPPELPSTDDRVRRRVNGDPLMAFGRPGLMNWDEAFPGPQGIGLAYTVEGRIDPAACLLSLRVIGAVNSPDGLRTNQPLIALPFYGPRADGRYDLAAADFGNEAVAVFSGALTLNFPLRMFPVAGQAAESAVMVVCDGDCPTIMGSGLRRLEVVAVGRPPVAMPAIDAGTDAATDARSDASPDVSADAPAETGVDAGMRLDAAREAGADVSVMDTAMPEAGTDAGTDVRFDAATDVRDTSADVRG